MRKFILAITVSFLVLFRFAHASEPISKAEAEAFLTELITEASLPKEAQREYAKSHPHLGVSLTETNRAGRLTFSLQEGDSPDLGTPATADWHGQILQNGVEVFGFRLRRNPQTKAVEVYHFWTKGVPKGLKVIHGFLI